MHREWTAEDTGYFLPLVIQRDGKTCFYCGVETCLTSEIPRDPKSTAERRMARAMKGKKATIDHLVPVSKGGAEFDIENMVVACLRCNQEKGQKFPKAFIRKKKKGN